MDTGNDDLYAELPGLGLNFFNDFDMLEVGGGKDYPGSYAPLMTLTEWQAHFSLWAAFKSPLVSLL